MKRRLAIFLIGIFITAIGAGLWVGALESPTNDNEWIGAFLVVLGLGMGIGVPIILGRPEQ